MFVYLKFNFDICSLVIKIAKLVSKAVLLEIILPAPGLIKPIVEKLIVEATPINISSVVINNTFIRLMIYSFSLIFNINFKWF